MSVDINLISHRETENSVRLKIAKWLRCLIRRHRKDLEILTVKRIGCLSKKITKISVDPDSEGIT